MSGIYFWKYPPENYFTGLTLVDKLRMDYVPADALPLFDIQTEEVGGLLQYSAGEFDLSLSIDTGETSNNGDSIHTFFEGGTRNYKFLVVVFFGTSPSSYKYFCGKFTNDDFTFGYGSRRINIRVKPIQDEVSEAMKQYKVGELDQDRSLDSFLDIIIPDEIDGYLNIEKSFASYGILIGDTTVKARRAIQVSGEWKDNLDVWSQFVELMQGTGLLWKIRLRSLTQVNFDNPKFTIYVFNLGSIPSGSNPIIIGDPQDTTILKNKKWLFLPYRSFDFSAHSDIPIIAHQGNIFNGVSGFNTDKFNITWNTGIYTGDFVHPGFLEDKRTSDEFKEDIEYIPTWPVDPNDITHFKNNVDTQTIELPQYTYTFPFQGSFPPFPNMATLGETITYARIFTDNNYRSYAVQSFAMSQYGRYVGKIKRQLKIKVLWDENHIYDVFEKLEISQESVSRFYYIARMENLSLQGFNNQPPSVDLTLIEV